MTPEELLRQYPLKRIKPFNGMAVTAAVWEEAHDYHRRSQALQTIFGHGSGILAGLEVIANDPPDTSLYILPGVAIDQEGQVIVLPEAVVYDIGQEMQGLFYVLLSYGESQRRSGNGNPPKGAPTYIESEFSILAQAALTDAPGVELARINRSSRTSVLYDAANPVIPGPDEIDLRYRREIGAPPEVRVGVVYLGQVADPRQGLGATYLAQTVNYLGRCRVLVEDQAALGPGISSNTLVYLVGHGGFELSAGVMNGLRNYVQRGRGTLFIEALDREALASFKNFLAGRELSTVPLEPRHPVLTQPYFFNQPPAGYDAKGSPAIEIGDGVIMSSANYGLMWQGEQRDGPASRDEIRSAVEWGTNILTYALNRRRG